MLTASRANLLGAIETAEEANAQDTHPLLEDGPCDDCGYAARCGSQRLACDAFAVWVAGRGSRQWQTAPRQPTRVRYVQLLERS